ncbi:MAG TPA: hypothetical protein VJ508_03620 [Saprospiraceae bacterium]|nr:hypothetical protein [Saprospiraceae bacterium]
MKRWLIYCILFAGTSHYTYAQDTINRVPFLEMRGYVKDLQGLFFADDLSSLSSTNLLHNRLNFRLNMSSRLTARLELRNRIFWGDQIAETPNFAHVIDQYSGLLKLSHIWVDENKFVAHSVIDRLMVQYATDQWDLRIGRQRINWGLNTIWNPNDLFNAYNFLDFDYEERPGNDAVRVQHFFRNNTAAEFAIKPGKHKNETIGAFLYRFNTSQFDIQLLAGVFNSDYVIGGGWAGHIKEAGFKGEISYFHPMDVPADTSGVWSMSVMADQTFKGDWYVSASILYNSSPPENPFTVINPFTSDLTAKNLFPFRYTFYTGAMKSFSPITSLSMAVIYSPKHHALILFPSFTWNVANNFDLGLIVQSAYADISHAYRTTGNAIFLRSKWSF